MFKAIVLACAIASPDQCWEYHDTRGPYEDRKRCVKRAHEMGNDIASIHEGAIMPKSYMCKILQPGMLTLWNPSQ
jgi:hypothetical protein